MSGVEKRTRAYSVPTPKGTATGPKATIVAAIVPPAVRPRPARRRAAPSQQATLAVAPVSPPPSQLGTMAVPTVPTMVATSAKGKELGLQDTMLATGDPDEIEIDLAESGVVSPQAAAVVASRARRTGRTPTFDTLSVVAVPRFRWAFVTGAVIAASVATWLALA